MVGGVALALHSARTTRDDARLDRCPDDAQIDFGLAGQDAADAVADVGAVEIEPVGPAPDSNSPKIGGAASERT